MTEETKTQDPSPSTYRAMREPMPSKQFADEALEGFYADLKALRIKYHITDVHCIMQVIYLGEAGEESASLVQVHLGDQKNGEGMAAFSYGEQKKERQERMNKLLAGTRQPL